MSDDLTSAVLNYLDEDQDYDEFWSEEPLELKEWLYHPDHYNLGESGIRPSKRQWKYLESLCQVDPKKCKFDEFIMVVGKGGGKNYWTIVGYLYLIYRLLCMESPQRYYGKDPDTYIDFINVAVNAPQAYDVFFHPLTKKIRRIKWFNENGPPSWKYKKYHLTQKMINFEKNIRLFSGHSETESMEGRNVFMAVLDEIDAFKSEEELDKTRARGHKLSAKSIYEALRSSQTTRFGEVGKIVQISYPRWKRGWILTEYKKAKKKNIKGTYLEFATTFQFNPTVSKNTPAIAKDYQKDPIMAKAKYECDPPDSLDVYFNPNLIEQCLWHEIITPVDLHALQIHMEADPYEPENRKYIFHEDFRGKPGMTYALHIDLAKSGDAVGFCMGHIEPFYDKHRDKEVDTIFTDVVLRLEKPQNGEIIFERVREIVYELTERDFDIGIITLDRYESVDTIQQLQAKGYRVENYSLDRTIEGYHTLKYAMIDNNIKIEPHPILIKELKELMLINGRKIDHGPTGSKDVADALAGMVVNVLKLPRKEYVFTQLDMDELYKPVNVFEEIPFVFE